MKSQYFKKKLDIYKNWTLILISKETKSTPKYVLKSILHFDITQKLESSKQKWLNKTKNISKNDLSR